MSHPRRAAVLSVGSELLLGDLTDTNATWISDRLRSRGVTVVHHLAARDEVEEIVDALRWLADRADLIIVGGGLGPTSDDLTRDAIAAALGVGLEFHEDLEEAIIARFAAMSRPMAPRNRRQAFAPEGAITCPPMGTAPAFAVDLSASRGPVRVIALPGVPWELHRFWAEFVDPQLDELGVVGTIVTRVVHVGGRGESDIAGLVEPLVEGLTDVTLAFLAKQYGVQVRLSASGSDRADAMRRSQPAVDAVVAALGPAVSGLDGDDLEVTVVRLLAANGQRVATGESATAGSIAARIGRVPGASEVLVGGLIAYRTEAKTSLAGIAADLVARHGAVSAQTSEALARAARERSGADWGIGVTGVAGPDTVDGLPVGTAFWALAHPDGTCETHGRVLPGDRPAVVLRLGSAALDLLRRRLSGDLG